MTDKQHFIEAGFNVVDPAAATFENKLIAFLKEHYPHTVRGDEVKLDDLKAALGLPVDDKTNGYGLNFVGRNFARAKYGQATAKAVRLNPSMSKHIDTTQNLVLKGDNLDSLKILKNHYSGKIKCIYIDPPYNTTSDEFVYPDRFNQEEAEVLGLMNLSDSDYARMEFSFKTKKSHNGWLAFMYPRLLLARDLLRKDGVIFISIDDNEQANLKLLCDEIFGEENLVSSFIVIRSEGGGLAKQAVVGHDYMLAYAKNASEFIPLGKPKDIRGKIILIDDEEYWIETDWLRSEFGKYGTLFYEDILDIKGQAKKDEIDEGLTAGRYVLIKKGDKNIVGRYRKVSEDTSKFYTILKHLNKNGVEGLENLHLKDCFDFPKPVSLVKEAILGATIKSKDSIVLDFFAGSGTTGHAVMQLNAEDGGNRKFILCQIDEPIKEDKPAYQFCIDSQLPPVISSITIERLKRAGEKVAAAQQAADKPTPDIGFKVFDSIDAPRLQWDEATGQIEVVENPLDGEDEAHTALNRIYHMIFTVGLDNPTQTPEVIIDNAVYKIGTNHYITNAQQLSTDDFSKIVKTTLKHGKVYIDGWTASLNGTLQNFKDDVNIVF
jgi:adenine-specific DNA-methyltransferase